MFASIIFANRDWLAPVGVTLAVALVFLVRGYRVSGAEPSVRGLCFALKLLGLVALGLCLLEPHWSGERARPGANHFVILADNSQGMQIKDRDATETRADSLRKLLKSDQAAWQSRLDEHFQVARYVFDSRLVSTKDFSELNFDGRASALGAALRGVKERFGNRPIAGVLLLTDGNATDISEAPPGLAGVPVFPVVMGENAPIRDLAVQKVAVSQTVFEDAPVNVQADVLATGYNGYEIVAQMLDRTGKKIEEQALKSQRDSDPLAFRFQFKPDKPGLSFYRLRVSAKNELEQFGNAALSTEATLANNARVVVVDRGRGPYRILYIAGRPNWEFKFLNRALAEDDQVHLVALIRVAKREPKFEFKGRVGESSNPLFRGFGNQNPEEIQRYDQPVLVRLNTRDQEELRGGFPTSPEELYAYHAVIIDDCEAEFFKPDQQSLLQRYVSERGGGLLMLGGAECFHQGKYARTPIGDMLPVYLDRNTENSAPQQGYTFSLSREGMLQPWSRVRANEADERRRVEAMPKFDVLNQVKEVKPGASVLATVNDGRREYPALVTQRFGHGRTAALLIGDLWQWGMHDAESHKDMDKSWRQTIRWLVSDVPNRIELATEAQRGDANQAMLLNVRVRDEKFQPMDNASVVLRVQPLAADAKAGAETNFIRLNAEPATSEPGLYQATYVPRETGGYQVTAFVTNAIGAEVARAEAGWSTDLAAEEFKSLKPNRPLLEAIAKKSGGELLTPARLDDFARALPNRRAPVTEAWTYPLWHTPLVFLFALLCFVAEWGLRRWKGMA
ncbi:MAG: hypothetical protein FJ386_06595 [Verrucomicrobia bacterium]|nr:hypothetical protein [Verrucomicrobiota bacterium]